MKKMNEKNKIAEIVRVLTVPSVMSGLAMWLFWMVHPMIYQNPIDFIVALVGLTVIPSMSYLAWYLVPQWRAKGRPLQRRLAMYFSAAGYLFSFFYSLLAKTAVEYKIVMCSYILSVVFLLFCNKVLHFKASGHACSIVGPALFVAIYCGGAWIMISLGIMAAVAWSSLQLKRHKPDELMVGGAISALSVVILSSFMI